MEVANGFGYPQGSTSLASYYNSIYRRSPLSDLFFAPQNVDFLRTQLEKILTQLTNEPIHIEVNNEFLQSMFDICSRNESMAYTALEGLNQLNEAFLEWEARIQYLSLRHRRQYVKYYIEGERLRTMPYGTPEKVMRGEVTVSPSGYMMSNPWRKKYGEFLQDVLCVGNHPKPCTRPYPFAVRT
jgi:hypothetical protein